MLEQNVPVISVVMSVCNSEKWLKEAIDSVLSQTFGDFEFLIVDDGSSDASLSIIRSYADRRIKLIVNESNLGVSNSVNKALKMARGEFIARMDADDICLPHRFERQVEFLRSNREIDVCGSWVKLIGDRHGEWRCPQKDRDIRCEMLFNNAMAQPAIMLRKIVVPPDGVLYEKDRRRVEDYELWSRLSRKHAMENIPEVLLEYRINFTNSSKKLEAVNEESHKVCMRAMVELGMELAPTDMATHRAISENSYPVSEDFLYAASSLFKNMIVANDRYQKYNSEALNAFLAQKWWLICRNSTGLGIAAWNIYRKNPLSHACTATLGSKFKFLGYSLVRKNSRR